MADATNVDATNAGATSAAAHAGATNTGTAQTAGERARIGSDPPAPAPAKNPETAGFWKATTEGRLLFTRCDSCSEPTWYPREFCPHCGTLDVTWEEAAGTGTVHSFTIVRRGALGPYAGGSPYVLAYVELDEGVRLMTNIVEVDEADLRIGLPVRVVFHDTGDGSALPRFQPAA